MAKKGPKHSISEVLKTLRQKRGWTLEEVSEFTGIPKATLHQYETGRSVVPHDRLQKLSRLYGVSIDYLVTGEDTPGQFAREFPEHFRILTRIAKDLPADRFDRLKTLMEYYYAHKGDIPDFDWDKIIDAHQENLTNKERKE